MASSQNSTHDQGEPIFILNENFNVNADVFFTNVPKEDAKLRVAKPRWEAAKVASHEHRALRIWISELMSGGGVGGFLDPQGR